MVWWDGYTGVDSGRQLAVVELWRNFLVVVEGMLWWLIDVVVVAEYIQRNC